MRTAHFLLPVLFTAACVEAKDPEVLLATTVESDIPALAEQVGLLSEQVGQVADNSGASQAEASGIGDCIWNIDTEGEDGIGTVSLGLAQTPCGGDTGPAAALALQLEEGSLSGTWTKTAYGELIIEMLGHRRATMEHASKDYDVSWTILDLEVYNEGGELRSWEATVSYNGFAGQVWMLDIITANGSIRGELTDGKGNSCLVGGSTSWSTVLCDVEPEVTE